MPRRAEIQPRKLEVDPVHGSLLVTQMINRVMLDGKKSVAEKMVYDALAIASEKSGKPAVEVLDQAVKTVTPVLEVRSRRVGGANYQVPIEVPQRISCDATCRAASPRGAILSDSFKMRQANSNARSQMMECAMRRGVSRFAPPEVWQKDWEKQLPISAA